MQHTQFPISTSTADFVELSICDLSIARAFFAGVPAARLLARARIAVDEQDLLADETIEAATWESMLARLSVEARDLVKRAVARHARAAADEGALPATEQTICALLYALSAAQDVDASPSEATGEGGGDADDETLRGLGAVDSRLSRGGPSRSAAVFEACARLATRASCGPWSPVRLTLAADQLKSNDAGITLIRPSNARLYPIDVCEEPPPDARLALLERAELDIFVARDPRELALAITRVERPDPDAPPQSSRGAQLATLVADLALLLKTPGALLLSTSPRRGSQTNETHAKTMTSWMPLDVSSADGAAKIADALERGRTTLPRVRAVVTQGGDSAIDALGAEMLRVAEHPFASAELAQIVARSGRPRDVIRLVTFFAIAPDPTAGARALAACAAPDVPAVLFAWLEAMLPRDGAPPPPGENPETSSSARLNACISALEPYPHLYAVASPLLKRVSEAPAPASGE